MNLRKKVLWHLLAMPLLMAGCNNLKPEPSKEPLAASQLDSQQGAAAPISVQNVSPADSPIAPVDGASVPSAAEAIPVERSELGNRPFLTLRPLTSEDPSRLIEHLREIDSAISDLVLAGSNDKVDKQMFIEAGLRLGKMKLAAGNQLAGLGQASDFHKKTGLLAQLVALSHMSGIGDVDAAKKLEVFARELSESSDLDLSHQSRVVLLGFELQNLQNGVQLDPNQLLAQAEALFQRAEDRNFPEFMMLQKVHYVLDQMGFKEAAERAKQIVVSEYQDSAIPDLRRDAWYFATENSQALANFNAANGLIGSPQFDPATVVVASRGLFEAFPTASTLEQLSSSIASLEYAGQVSLSQDLATVVRQNLTKVAPCISLDSANRALAEHEMRVSLVGKPLDLTGIVGFDGAAFDWAAYQGKTVLVDFWATWCIPCLKELPKVQSAYSEFSGAGFDVISVNMDESPKEASKFVSDKKFPWRSFYFEGQPGFASDFAKRVGLTMIPFVILVGPDGKVADIHVRGDNIAPRVRALLNKSESLLP